LKNTVILFRWSERHAMIELVKFPSEEWTREYVVKLNSNPKYEDAARNWEGAITFVVEPDDSFPQNAFIYLDLYHGKCRDAKFAFAEADVPVAEYKYSGPYNNWRRLINKEIDPIQGLLTGKFRLQGSMMKIMRFTKAAKEMVSTASLVQAEF
jgi:putative sterol carrier protein